MLNIEQLKNEFAARLKPLNPEKVILFGSYARGNQKEDSDIDLYVVTGDDFIPRNFREKMEIKLKISQSILDLRMKYPFDLVVHTKPMHKKFIDLDSSFAREIQANGVRLI
ncbi:MAG: nucleotidyltransferase domain-containing protein [Candidatus Melainabacteria bacterium HGW-Melainabacteria-1]|nr:MAG: nucleotidyltransferase domain-containing protein [Candidatus Melainabacteria bacterium HGW-Melainabacteria-1]